MTDSFAKQGGLAHLGLAASAQAERGSAGVVLGERSFPAIVNLRGDPGDKTFTSAVKKVLGSAPPSEPNRVAESADAALLWLAPDEWWAATSGSGAALAEELRDALGGLHCTVTDVSESRTCLRLAGPRARDLLAKGCSIDLHPRVFGPGQCAQTQLAKALVVIHQIGESAEDGPAFEIYVLRSFADYLWNWLADAAQEYGLAVVMD